MRTLIAALSILSVATVGFASAAPLDDLAATAAKKPPVLWYESSPPEQMQQVIAAFNKRYPDIKVRYIRNTGGGGVAAKIVQEAQANAPTASFITADVQQLNVLLSRNLLATPDFKALGIADSLVGSPNAAAVGASLAVLVWNKGNVTDAEVPKTWADVTDMKWKQRSATWVRASMYASLAAVSGEDKARDLIRRIVEQKAKAYASNAEVAQQTASGEVDIGIGLYHTTQPLLASGAPIGMKFIDPVPMTTIWGAVVKTPNGNTEGAEVLLSWLTTLEGAKAYEAATMRGNPRVKGTHHSELVEGKTLAEYPISKSADVQRLDLEFSEMLSIVSRR